MDLYSRFLECVAEGDRPVLATVVDATGSTPQKPGCQALLDGRGALLGTLGGGLVEAEAVEAMRAALADRRPRLYEKRLDEEYRREAGPICGGVMRILINPGAETYRDQIQAALDARMRRTRGYLATTIAVDGDSPCAISWHALANNGSPKSPHDEAIAEAVAKERPALVQVSPHEVLFVEPVVPVPRLLVVGGGHVGLVVVEQALALGFDVTVIDDRPEFADAVRFPAGVHAQHGSIGELVARYPKDRDTYIVLVSKGHRPDAEALEACIHDDLAFLGMIGSRRKVQLLRTHFLESSIATKAEFDRVVAPIGYDIGAVTVPEIGVSIAAQLVAARRHPAAVRDAAVKAL